MGIVTELLVMALTYVVTLYQEATQYMQLA